MSVEIQKFTPHGGFSAEAVATLCKTFFKGAQPHEVELGLHLAARYGLDPFTREIWFVPGVGIMIGRDGYLAAARRTGELEGFSSGVIYEGDTLALDAESGSIKVGTTAASLAAGKVIAGWCRVARKGQQPIVKIARFAEYSRGGQGPWGKFPSAMIQKVAESMALRAAFGISGAVPADEVDEGQKTGVVAAPMVIPPAKSDIPAEVAAPVVPPAEKPVAKKEVVAEVVHPAPSAPARFDELKALCEGFKESFGLEELKRAFADQGVSVQGGLLANAKKLSPEKQGALIEFLQNRGGEIAASSMVER